MELEKLLELCFYVLEVPFSRRIYHEEINADAAIDDATSEITTDDLIGSFYTMSPNERLYLSLIRHDIMTSAQNEAIGYADAPIMFKRIAKTKEGLSIIYSVWARKLLSSYEEHVDNIISEGGVESELIVISTISDQEDIADLIIHYKSEGPLIEHVGCLGDETIKYFKSRGIDPEERMSILKKFRNKPYQVKEFCKAIFDFIR